MSTCTELSDRMPDVAHGGARWTELEASHLAACADCRAEWALVTVATRLGTPLAPPGDPAVVASLLLERLDRERAIIQRRLRVWTTAGLAAAAAVIIAIWAGAGGGRAAQWRSPGSAAPRVATATAGPSRPPSPGPNPDTGAAAAGMPARAGRSPETTAAASLASAPELPLPEIDDLPTEALDSMLEVLDEPAARADGYELPGFGESGDRELERALTGLEG